jgi:hypothetical protein
MNTSMRTSIRGSFNIQSFQQCPYPFCQKESWLFANVCQLSCTKSTHHQESIPFAPNLKVVGLIQSCQGVHQDWSTWNIQLGAHLRRQWIENNVQNMLWPFWICCDAIWPYYHACYFPTFNEQCFSWVLE